MKAKQIVFTDIKKAELIDTVCDLPKDNEVMVKVSYTAISCGTEKANFSGDINVDASRKTDDNIPKFPRYLGYSGSGIVYKTGKNITKVKEGDRVVISGYHKNYCTVNENAVTKITDDNICLKEASFGRISTFSLAGLRKTRLEIGESIIVMGLGILGMFAVQFAKAAGAYPVIAADPIKERRDLALMCGADFTFDVNEENFVENVKKVSGGGVHTAIEVTGRGEAFDTVLDCMRPRGRVALLGCTRNSDFTIDYYRKIHFPGITVVGAHTCARPETESCANYWTHEDDTKTFLNLISGKRIDVSKMIFETHSPNDAQKVYNRLLNDKDFPIGVVFDWENIGE